MGSSADLCIGCHRRFAFCAAIATGRTRAASRCVTAGPPHTTLSPSTSPRLSLSSWLTTCSGRSQCWTSRESRAVTSMATTYSTTRPLMCLRPLCTQLYCLPDDVGRAARPSAPALRRDFRWTPHSASTEHSLQGTLGLPILRLIASR